MRTLPSATVLRSLPLAPTSGRLMPASQQAIPVGQRGRSRITQAADFEGVDLTEQESGQRFALRMLGRQTRQVRPDDETLLPMALIAPVGDRPIVQSVGAPKRSGYTTRWQFSSATGAKNGMRVAGVDDDAGRSFESGLGAGEGQQIDEGADRRDAGATGSFMGQQVDHVQPLGRSLQPSRVR